MPKLLLVLYGSIWALPFLKMTANTSQLVNLELFYDVMSMTREGRSYGLLCVNTVNSTPFEGTSSDNAVSPAQRNYIRHVMLSD